jgi:ribonuclease P protein component
MPGNNSAASSKFPDSGSPSRPPLARGGRKSKRLLKHADFQRVYQSGRRQFTGNMTVFFLRRQNEAEQPSSPRVGLTVGKVLGGAVDRNRIKRRMREAVRLSSTACEGPVDIVFNPRKSVLTLPFAELIGEVARGLRLAAQRARVAEAKRSANEK